MVFGITSLFLCVPYSVPHLLVYFWHFPGRLWLRSIFSGLWQARGWHTDTGVMWTSVSPESSEVGWLRVVWRNPFLKQKKTDPQAHTQQVYLAMDMWFAVMSVFWLRPEIVFGVTCTYKLTVQQYRNRDSEGRNNGQMTFLNFNSYVQNLRFLYSRQIDMDRQTDRENNPLWAG